MSGRSSGFAIGFGIQDGASAGIDAINKRISALTAPAERFNKSIQKFGEVSGINRAAEGIQTLGDRALGAARAVERLAGPMAGLASAASLGGMVELSRKWAEAGNQIAKTSSALNTPVPRLSALRGAARLAGISAETMDASLKGLGDRLADAKFNRAPAPLVALMNQFHIGFEGLAGEARTGADAINEVMKAAATYKDPHAQQRFLEQFGISPEMAALIKDGKSNLETLTATAQRSGGVMTTEMAENASKMNRSWAELGLAIEGVGNRIVSSWSGTATKVLDTTTHWIENNKKLADSYAENAAAVVTAVGLLAGLRVAPWILKALGLGGMAGTLGVPLVLSGDSGPGSITQTPEQIEQNRKYGEEHGISVGEWFNRMWHGRFDSNPDRPRAGPRVNSVPGGGAAAGNALDGPTVARAKLVHDGLVARGMDSNTAWGFAGNAVQESRADPHSAPGDRGAAHGLFMWRDSDDGGRRYTNYVNKYGHAPEQGTLDEQLDYTMYELQGSERGAWRNIRRAGDSPGEKAAAISTFYERPKDTAAEESRRWGIVSRLSAMAAGDSGMTPAGGNGTVRVDVHLHGATPGTTATATGTGRVMVTPPNIQTSMPLAH